MRAKVISWSLVMLAIIIPSAFVLLGCATSTGKIATVESIGVWNVCLRGSYCLSVGLKPTALAEPNIDYVVELYEKDQLRATTTVKWNQAEINVLDVNPVEFPMSQSEWEAYGFEDVSHIFTVRVYDQSKVTPELGKTTSEYFRDPHLESAVRTALGESTGGDFFAGEITKSDLAGLKQLNAWHNHITDLKGLEYCTNLTVLSLPDNNISDITALSKLTSLTELDLQDNQISDVAPLAKLTNLTIIGLSGNKISDISPLLKNSGLGTGDFVDLENNPLSATSRNVYVPQLEQRGVEVFIN